MGVHSNWTSWLGPGALNLGLGLVNGGSKPKSDFDFDFSSSLSLLFLSFSFFFSSYPARGLFGLLPLPFSFLFFFNSFRSLPSAREDLSLSSRFLARSLSFFSISSYLSFFRFLALPFFSFLPSPCGFNLLSSVFSPANLQRQREKGMGTCSLERRQQKKWRNRFEFSAVSLGLRRRVIDSGWRGTVSMGS
jgi:hypothetical protein